MATMLQIAPSATPTAVTGPRRVKGEGAARREGKEGGAERESRPLARGGASEEDGTGLVAALGGRSERRGEGGGGDW